MWYVLFLAFSNQPEIKAHGFVQLAFLYAFIVAMYALPVIAG